MSDDKYNYRMSHTMSASMIHIRGYQGVKRIYLHPISNSVRWSLYSMLWGAGVSSTFKSALGPYWSIILGKSNHLKGPYHDQLSFYKLKHSFCWVQRHICCSNRIFDSPTIKQNLKFLLLARHIKLAIQNNKWHAKLAIRNNKWHANLAIRNNRWHVKPVGLRLAR